MAKMGKNRITKQNTNNTWFHFALILLLLLFIFLPLRSEKNKKRRIINYHKAARTVVRWMLKNVDPINKASIIPTVKNIGAPWCLLEEKQITIRQRFEYRMSATLGCRAVKELKFYEISTGAQYDLEKTTNQAHMMVNQLGLRNMIGHVSFHDSSGMHEKSFQKPYREATENLIKNKVRVLIDFCCSKVMMLLIKNKDKLYQLPQLLITMEVIAHTNLENILGKRVFYESGIFTSIHQQ